MFGSLAGGHVHEFLVQCLEIGPLDRQLVDRHGKSFAVGAVANGDDSSEIAQRPARPDEHARFALDDVLDELAQDALDPALQPIEVAWPNRVGARCIRRSAGRHRA